MGTWKRHIQELKKEFHVTEAAHMAALFQRTMVDGLAGKKTSLKMLPSFLSVPTGRETGKYLALDFGGTNIRVMQVELLGNGEISILGQRSSPLRHPQGLYDYSAAGSTATELFDFIADLIHDLVDPGDTYALGHTFSFPIQQTDANNAVLLCWTKEIRTQGVEGKNVTQILSSALERKGLTNVVPQAVINDTVGCLLTAAYQYPGADIGSICGTGHNTAYFESNGPMIINLEAGNYDLISGTGYDERLDCMSERPGTQKLEKMISGRYLGEIARLILHDLADKGLFREHAAVQRMLATAACIGAEDLACMLNDTSPDLSGIADLLRIKLHLAETLREERIAIKEIAHMLVIRSACLAAATYCGILQHIDPDLRRTHVIAVDGSLFEKMPGYAATIRIALEQGLGDKAGRVRTVLSKSGSGIGAAIAAAVVGKSGD